MSQFTLFRKTGLAVGALGLASMLGVTTAADGQVVYSDSFSRVTGSGDANGNPDGVGNGSSDWGSNDNALGGSVVGAWTAGRSLAVQPTGGAQFVTNGSRGYLYDGAVNTNASVVTAETAPGFSIAFDFSRNDPAVTTTTTNGFINFGTGYDETISQFSEFEVSGNSTFALLFQQAANNNVGNAEVFAGGVSQGTFDYGDPTAEHSVVIDFTPTIAGNYGVGATIGYAVSVDGSQLQTGSILGSAAFGDLAFGTNLFSAAYIDNLVVTAVPEPASLALLGLGGLAMLGRRRSQR